MVLRCPKCQQELTRDFDWHCVNNHHYDIAKEGYVNLVLANQKHSTNPGDDALSLKSRQQFLSHGYYQPLAEEISKIVVKYLDDGDSFLDAGCGSGYYLNYLVNNCTKKLNYYAVDIAKKGVAMCAKMNPETICFVGNVFHLPIVDGSLTGLMSVFTPYSSEEFSRVVKDGGYVIAVSPGEKHLIEMKEIVYKQVYTNEETGYKLDDFTLIERNKVTYVVTLEKQEDIETLWRMTPYYHTTYIGDSEKLLNYKQLTVTCDFLVSVYKRGAR